MNCDVIKFARVGEKSDKLFSARIFPEENMFTVEVRAYNGDAQPMAGDAIPRSEYENYDPFLVFEFYQKDSVVALRDTCNWIIDTLTAQIAEMESKQNNALSEKAIEKGCLTWNERINQMTAEEKAKLIDDLTNECPYALGYSHQNPCAHYEECQECWLEFLNSPYTEGEKHEG
jgi:hypothetical protein